MKEDPFVVLTSMDTEVLAHSLENTHGVQYKGHVYIEGDITDCNIKARGHIVVCGKVESASLTSVFGSIFFLYEPVHKSTAKASKNIFVSSCTNADLCSDNDIILERHATDSHLYAHRNVLCEGHGCIDGGSCTAGIKIQVSEATNKATLSIEKSFGEVQLKRCLDQIDVHVGAYSKTLNPCAYPIYLFVEDEKLRLRKTI